MRRLINQISLFLAVATLMPSPVTARSSDSPSRTVPGSAFTRPTDQSQRLKSAPDSASALGAQSAQGGQGVPTGTFSTAAFQSDLFSGVATAEVPITVAAGTAGIAPKVALRYNSYAVDELGQRDQGQSAGLGWTLDIGGFILRDLKNSTTTIDDAFKLVFGGVAYDLVLIDGAQTLYRTKDEVFLKIQYLPPSDSWLLTTKDGIQHRFGFNPDSRAMTRGYDLTTAITYKYLLDRVTTTSGVAVQYAYTKQTGTIASNGLAYDQASYPDSITWAYSGSSLVGAPRQVLFSWASRSDWTDTSASTIVSFFERKRLDTIEVRAAGSLVRKYALAADYSIDRDPSHTWGGGASGDLTLKTVTIVGSDAASALPPLTFAYTEAHLSGASNGIGGTVAYAYNRVAATIPLYHGCLRPLSSSDEFPTVIGCQTWGARWDPDPYGFSTLYGYAVTTNVLGPQTLYEGCVAAVTDEWGTASCYMRGGRATPDPWGFSTLRGYTGTVNAPGTRPLYSACVVASYDEYGNATSCLAWGLQGTPDPWGYSSLAGYVHIGRVDRYRAVSRSLGDGRGGTSTLTFTYTGLGLDGDGKEFRGHGSVRAIDPLGHYTDTWFHQDDLLKGRPYHSQTRHTSGALLAETTNSWTTTTPYPGVTAAQLVQTDVATCDDTGGGCRIARMSFEYDAFANPTRTYHWGDVAIGGDERDERVDWVVDATAWLHRPKRAALHDATGALLRERWLSYDGLGWGSLGARGLLTRDESRLGGGPGSAGNPSVTSAYDAHGNRTTITDARGCTTTIVYESSGRTYPATVTTCLGHTTSFTYDPRWGERTSETDPNHQTTSYTYDAFGRLTKIIGPLDTGSFHGSMSRSYHNLGDPAAQRIRTTRTTAHGSPSATWSEVYFDGLGRGHLARSQGPEGQIIQRETAYDSRGLITTRSAPHFSTEVAAVTRFTFDARGRQTLAQVGDGTSVRTAYTPGAVTVTDQRGNSRRRSFDVYGRLTRVEEGSGGETYATAYAYDGSGALVRVTNQLGHVTTLTYDLVGRKTATSDPNTGTWMYGYDLGGNLVSQTDARNQTLTFTHDLQGRMLTKTYPGGARTQWTYDNPAVAYSKGRVTRVADAVTVTAFGYDALGRVIQTQRLLDATTYTMSQSHNALGQVVSRAFPDGETVTYRYNEAGWLASIPGYVSSIIYNARGQQTQLHYDNGVSSTSTYHATNFRLVGRSTTGPSGTLQNLTYTDDPAGNITQVQDGVFTGSRTFTYDALNRLTSVSGVFGAGQAPITQNYRYDAIGNLLEKAGILYTYTDPAHRSAVTSRTDGATYTYDANGNTLSSAGRALAWDADNRLVAVTAPGGLGATFAYDAAGARVRKTTAAGVTRYPFQGYEVDPYGVVTKYVGGVAKRSTGATLFYHNDHLGGVNVVTDASGARLQLVEYDPWGQVTRSEGAADPTHRFTGKELDPESGLYHYGGRYYDASLARFVSPDPFVPAPGDPQALNRYSYVINNPVNLVDPTGFFFEKVFRSIKKWARGNEVMSITMGLSLLSIPLPEVHVVAVSMLTATESGRVALAAAIIAGTAVATFYCGGCGVAVGALTGELLGLYSAGMNGGDLLTGVAVGGVAGAATGYLGEYMVAAVPDGGWSINVGRWAVEGGGQGIAVGYAGGRGNIQSILLASAIGSTTAIALNSAYYGMVDYNATFQPGGEALRKDVSTTMPVEGANNVGLVTSEPGSCFLCEGAPVSRAVNRIPGISATSGFHDALLVRLELAGISQLGIAALNAPTMLPSAAFSYGVLLPGLPTAEMVNR